MKIFRRLSNHSSLPSWYHAAAALWVGSSAGFLVYIFYLQTAVFSRRYLLLAIATAVAASMLTYWLLKRHPFAQPNNYFMNRRSFLLACLLFLLALPSYFFLPPYPDLPFLQRKSTLIITIRTGAEPVAWSQFRRIYLNSGVEKLGFTSFQISGAWIARDDDFILLPEREGQISWHGRVGRRASFAFPVPSEQLRITTTWDKDVRQVSSEKSPYVQNKNFVPPAWYTSLVYAVMWIPLFFCFVLSDGFPRIRQATLPVLIFILAWIQASLQLRMLEEEFHRPLAEAIQTVQLARHVGVLQGTAPNPWQYRVFSEWLVELFLFSSKALQLNNSIVIALFGLRVLQNTILLALAYVYFVRLGTTKTTSLFGVFLLGGGMLHAFYQSDLSFNTYFDVIFFLLGGILILAARYEWLPVLMIPAALNRETSLLIPVLLIAWSGGRKSTDRARAFVYGLIGVFVWALIFVGLRLYYPDAPMFRVGDELLPGFDLLRYNLSVPEMPVLLFQTIGLLPLLGLLAHRYWNPFVRIGYLLLVPAWTLVHAFSSIWAETRLFLVVAALVFIPAVLPLVERRLQGIRQPISPQKRRTGESILVH